MSMNEVTRTVEAEAGVLAAGAERAVSAAASGRLPVAYDHTIFTMQTHGGISRYFAELIPRVARAHGIDVCLYMGLYINRYGLEGQRRAFRAFGGFRRPNLRKTHQLALRISDRLFARFARKWEPRVYHATYYTELAPRLSACRVITVHDFIYERLDRPVDSVLKRVAKRPDGLICVSAHTKRDLLEIVGVPERKVRVIHHGNSLHGVRPGPRAVEGPYILFVGTRYSYKNFVTLLRAYASSASVRRQFRLACFGGGPFTSAEMEEAARHGVADRLLYLGNGSDEALAGAYAHAAALVYPSQYEGFGLPLLEAMSQGCPVVSSNASSLPEVGGDAVAYFDPLEVDDLRSTLERVLSDGQFALALREAGRRREAMFNWDRCAAETAAFYQFLAG
jgi:glycosyltransferase involved in cell wall biosynthesis